MAKIRTYTTTEFYKNPSEALRFVKEGGTVYLGYKNIKTPVAVLTDYSTYQANKQKPEKKFATKHKNLWEKYKGRVMNVPDLTDSTKVIRKMRDSE